MSEETEKKYAAAQAIDTAEAALALARENEAHDGVRRVLGESPESPLTVAEAQAAVTQAEADYRTLRSLCEGLAERIENEQSSLRYVDSAIEDAIREVVSASPEGQRLVADYCKKLDAFNLADKTLNAVSSFLTRELHGKAINHHTSAAYGYQKLEPDPAWIAAIAALMTDADTLLPE